MIGISNQLKLDMKPVMQGKSIKEDHPEYIYVVYY
jgi:hypothetical protein